MKRFLFVLVTGSLLSTLAEAQNTSYKNTIRLGIDYTSLDAPDDLGYRFLGRYARHLGKDRVVLEASLGYLKIQNQHPFFDNYITEGRPRKRVTADFTASFDFVKNTQHALRLGFGPSVWYREDDQVVRINFGRGSDGSLTDVRVDRNRVEEVNLGVNVVTEYEYAASNRVTLGARLGFTTFKAAGISSLAGLNIGYRF